MMDIQCIEATDGTTIKGGYKQAQVYVAGKRYHILQHRVAFEQAWSYKLKPGQVVRHTCDTPACVNPLHLQLGTQADNVNDMVVRGRHWRAGTTHCHVGHPFDEANTYVTPGGARYCRACKAARAREARACSKTS